MNKILLSCILFCIPLSVSAELEVFLSSNHLPYHTDTWTSGNYPDASASNISVKRYFYRESLTQEFSYSEVELQTLIKDLYPELTQAQSYQYYLRLIEVSRQDFEKYIAFAIHPDADDLITDKASLFLLTPFERTFRNCGLNLTQRRTIAKDLISRIYSGAITDIDAIQYSNQTFGDCIIPFPDSRRGGSVIPNSFPSNQVIARSNVGNPLRFSSAESDVKLFSLSQVTLSADFDTIEENNLLDVSSTRVEQDQNFPKQTGKNKILFLHQNHTINPFETQYLTGNTLIGYRIAGISFSPTHPLFLRSSDSEEKRTISKWQKGENGIYMKTIVQENTFTQSGAVYIPNQTVDATTYYAIIYNYDTSAPECEANFFSHDASADANFIFPEYPWFRTTKYGYFLCMDEESGCKCDSSLSNCFIKNDASTYHKPRVFTTPKALSHNALFQNSITNMVGMTHSCSTGTGQKIYYDRSVPEIGLTLSGADASLLEKEYVNNDGVLYDGIQVPDASLSHIKDRIEFEANENLQMRFVLRDRYFPSKTGEGVSGLASYKFTLFELENNLWSVKISSGSTFPMYNTGSNLKTEHHSYTLNALSIPGVREIFTKTGEYQAQMLVSDAAGNITRLIYYFTIIPGPIDVGRSVLAVQSGSTLYGNGVDAYLYTLTLKDRYENLISGRQIQSLSHSCAGLLPNCKFLRTDMTSFPPSGSDTLEIFNFSSSSDALGRVRFFARSKSPGTFTERFRVEFQNPAETRSFLAGENTFLKPYQGVLEVFHSGSWVSDILPVGVEARYRLRPQNLDGRSYSWTLNNFSSALRAKHPLTSFSLSGTLSDTSVAKEFRGTFQSTLPPDENHKTLLLIGSGNLSQATLSYTLSGDTISYLLSPGSRGDDPVTLSDTGELQNPVKILGNLQAVGNTQNLSERQNFTNIDSSVVRSALRKNIEAHIKNRQHNTSVGGIKYIDKSSDTNKLYVLESDPNFETLIVRNGNIHIREDFNSSGKKVGIISYIDGGYSNMTGYQNVGNLYVEPEVESIQAFIYADGAVISSDSGVPLSGDLVVRTPLLQKQLKILGALFSRNTLAGGRELAGEYILPGNQKTNNQHVARIYDLYYLRRGNENCTQDIYGFCDTPHYMILEYDTRIAESPPKLFSY